MFLFVISLLDYYVDGETLLDYYGKGNQFGFGGVDVQMELGGQPWSTGWSMDWRSHGPIWFVGFFWLWVVVRGFFFVWLWLVVADWEVVEEEGCWVVAGGAMMEVILLKQDDPNKMPTPIELRSITDPNKNSDLNWKTYGDLGMGLCWIIWVFFFCVCFPRKFLGLGLLEISLFFFFFEFMGLICCRIQFKRKHMLCNTQSNF